MDHDPPTEVGRLGLKKVVENSSSVMLKYQKHSFLIESRKDSSASTRNHKKDLTKFRLFDR